LNRRARRIEPGIRSGLEIAHHRRIPGRPARRIIQIEEALMNDPRFIDAGLAAGDAAFQRESELLHLVAVGIAHVKLGRGIQTDHFDRLDVITVSSKASRFAQAVNDSPQFQQAAGTPTTVSKSARC
jgi:hypothetical protein